MEDEFGKSVITLDDESKKIIRDLEPEFLKHAMMLITDEKKLAAHFEKLRAMENSPYKIGFCFNNCFIMLERTEYDPSCIRFGSLGFGKEGEKVHYEYGGPECTKIEDFYTDKGLIGHFWLENSGNYIDVYFPWNEQVAEIHGVYLKKISSDSEPREMKKKIRDWKKSGYNYLPASEEVQEYYIKKYFGHLFH